VEKFTVTFHRKAMTRPMTTIDNVISFLTADLPLLYDQYHEWESNGTSDLDLNYLEGVIDRTQVVLVKCGVEYQDYEQYLEQISKQKWIPA
jgi:hypothetical protein